MSLLDAEQSARYIESLTASVQALEADLAATRDTLRQAETECRKHLSRENPNDLIGLIRDMAQIMVTAKGNSDEAMKQLEQAQARIAALEQVILWALGEGCEEMGSDFPMTPKDFKRRPFYWRTELRERFEKAQADARGREEKS